MLLLHTMQNRAGLLVRCVAKAVDFILVAAAMEVLPTSGWLGGILYMLISDGLMDGRSVGKRFIGLRAVTKDGAACTIKGSIIRNSTIAAGLLFWRIPFFGWVILLIILGVEFLLMFGSDDHTRAGDEFAGTYVIEDKKNTAAESAAQEEGEIKEIV